MTPEGLAMVKRFEGFRDRPYRDAVGVLTVGYGTTFPLSEEEATWLMTSRLDAVAREVARLVTVPLTPHRLDALTSFAYNVGLTAFANSTLLFLLNDGHYDQVPAQLRRWTHGGGRVLRGLAERRSDEIALWES